MSDREHSLLMLQMASRDITALSAMTDRKVFSDEIFGFHAQQAVEKILKAWLNAVGVKYPKIHDLERLIEILKASGQSFPQSFLSLQDLTDYAVIFRYEMLEPMPDHSDRGDLLNKVRALFDHASAIVSSPASH